MARRDGAARIRVGEGVLTESAQFGSTAVGISYQISNR